MNPRDPRPGEIQMKNWVANEAARCGVKPVTIYAWRRRYGAYKNLRIRRVDSRLIYVTPATSVEYQKCVAEFHELTNHQFFAVTSASAMLDHLRARLGEHSAMTQRFQKAAQAAGEILNQQPSTT